MKLEKKHENNKFVADAANNNFRHVGTLKYINLFYYTFSTGQIYHTWIVHEYKCLSSFLFFRFSSNCERERVYKIGYKEKRSQSLLIFFFRRGSWGVCFLFYGLIDFMLFLILAWRNGSFVSEIFFFFFYPEYLALILSATNPVQQLTFSFFADGKKVPLPFLGSQPII